MARTKQPYDIPGGEYLAKRYAKAHDHGGMMGGWIYDEKGNPLYHGWLRYFIGYRRSIMAWAKHHAGVKSHTFENGVLKTIPCTPLDLANMLKGKRIKK